MADDLDAVIERIKAVMALQEGASTPEEAAVAAAKIQAILLRHNLDMATVERHTKAPDKDLFQCDVRLADEWEAKLLAVVAQAHACHAMSYEDDRGANGYRVIGHDHNTRVVMLVFPWLRRVLANLASDAHIGAAMEGDFVALMRPDTWERSYMVGAIEGVYDAYQERSRKDDPQGTGTELMLDARDATLRKLREEIEKVYENVTERNIHPPEAYATAYRAGKTDSQRINLDPQIEQEDSHESLERGSAEAPGRV